MAEALLVGAMKVRHYTGPNNNITITLANHVRNDGAAVADPPPWVQSMRTNMRSSKHLVLLRQWITTKNTQAFFCADKFDRVGPELNQTETDSEHGSARPLDTDTLPPRSVQAIRQTL